MKAFFCFKDLTSASTSIINIIKLTIIGNHLFFIRKSLTQNTLNN